MSFLKHKEVPLGLLVICSFVMLFEYYFNIPALTSVADELKVWVVILSAFALVIGGFSLLRRIYRHISRRTPGEWQYDVIGLLLLIAMVGFGLGTGTGSYWYRWFFDNFYYSSRSTMFSCGGYYVYSTFYRAMRTRNIDATIVVAFAVTMLIGAAPIYHLVFPGILPIYNWIQDFGQIGAMRGFNVAMTMGLTLLTLRIMMGMETAAIGLIPGVEEQ
jgi:hypothetical protein